MNDKERIVNLRLDALEAKVALLAEKVSNVREVVVGLAALMMKVVRAAEKAADEKAAMEEGAATEEETQEEEPGSE